MNRRPSCLLSALNESQRNDIIKLMRTCWRDAAKHLEILGVGISDFMIYYGIVNEITDHEHYCEKFYNFAAYRCISAQQLAYAFVCADRREICRGIFNIVKPKTSPQCLIATADTVAGFAAEIKQLKETIACRDKEITLLVNVVMCRDEKIEKMSRCISDVAKIVL